ncbi:MULTISPECIES: hypothetical protein [unclassified Chitinophaga]|uniref:hypothetical protein n=1 Tax=unclassified Chitinophaga TaxID=2619133 RepID=UPI0009D5A524|nr:MULTISPECIES: hypothetical protein [unclassified Chitinophaga]OMP74988.1 hypothetical protein BW716_32555 [[Flexibacter] sp. ATCC 35208]WPV64526.1 hypothetical protein QQL36_22235 [Chitinophaga sp. LS1]
MDAKNIFIACNHNLNKINWEIVDGGSEWRYIGVGVDYQVEKVRQLLRTYFNNPELYLVTNRSNAYTISLDKVAETIEQVLESSDVIVSEIDFTTMAVFNRIGVMKLGRRDFV